MCEKEKFVIDFEDIRESDETFSFNLDDEYFQSIEDTEIRGGQVETTVKVSRVSGCFKVAFRSKGYVVVDCSRCLDPMHLDIDTNDELFVKLGEEYVDEGDEVVTVPETDQRFDTFWHIYEFIALAIPAQHCHEEGGCNEDMLEILEGSENLDDSEQVRTDQRWAKLKSLLNDNNK